MNHPNLHLKDNSTRLVRVLSELVGAGSGSPQGQFAVRFGALIDLSDSILLARAQASLKGLSFTPGVSSPRGIRDEFLRLRADIVKFVLRCCVPGTSNKARLRFPEPEPGQSLSALGAAPFVAFYGAMQREIDFRARRLQARIRDEVAGCNPRLARLCALDGVLDKAMAGDSRAFFTAVPNLLEARFAQHLGALLDDSGEPDEPSRVLLALREETQALLLAELEARLLPTLGLVEALEEDQDQE